MADSQPPQCPICSQQAAMKFARARDVEYETSGSWFEYWRCDQCDVVFLANPPVDKLREIYPSNYYSYCTETSGTSRLVAVKEWLDKQMFRRVVDRIPGSNLKVLDVGGGAGWLLSIVRALSSRIDATHEVDLDEHAGAAATAAGHIFHAVPIEQFSTEERFDLIIMLNLIEHVASPSDVLQAMRRLLSPTGLLLIKTPNFDTLDQRLFRSRWGGLHCPRHWVLFTRSSLVRVAESCGLVCVEARYTQGGSQWACSILGLLSDWKWVTITPERPMWRHPLFRPIAALGAAFDLLRLPFARTDQMLITLRRSDADGGCAGRVDIEG